MSKLSFPPAMTWCAIHSSVGQLLKVLCDVPFDRSLRRRMMVCRFAVSLTSTRFARIAGSVERQTPTIGCGFQGFTVTTGYLIGLAQVSWCSVLKQQAQYFSCPFFSGTRRRAKKSSLGKITRSNGVDNKAGKAAQVRRINFELSLIYYDSVGASRHPLNFYEIKIFLLIFFSWIQPFLSSNPCWWQTKSGERYFVKSSFESFGIFDKNLQKMNLYTRESQSL